MKLLRNCQELSGNCDENQRPEWNWKNHFMTKYNGFWKTQFPHHHQSDSLDRESVLAVKKWATSQSFIWKEITTYRIGTLEAPLVRQADGELKKFFSKVDQPVETDPSAGMAMDMAGTYPSSCIVSAQTLLSGKDPQLTPARGSLHKLYKKNTD